MKEDSDSGVVINDVASENTKIRRSVSEVMRATEDFTLSDKNQLIREEHLTFVDDKGRYLDHVVCSDKKGPTLSRNLMIHSISLSF